MKKFLVTCCLMFGFLSSAAFADARSELQNRLNEVSSFHARFSQTVNDAGGATIQQGQGELWMKRPNLFHWHMTSPDESVLVSDGRSLWFYSPFVEQVTVTRLDSVTSDTPFMLIARNSPTEWNKYDVQQQGDEFQLTSRTGSSGLRSFTINVTRNGIINRFVTVEQDGQRSTYVLQGVQTNSVDSSKFTFTPPRGVTIDDQRQ